MSHYPIIKEIDRLIFEGATSYHTLDEVDKDSLTLLSMKGLGRNIYECVTEVNDFDDTIDRLAKFIHTGSIDNALELAESMRDQTTDYFAPNLSKLFDERLEELQNEVHRENGLRSIQHKDNGETTWIRA